MRAAAPIRIRILHRDPLSGAGLAAFLACDHDLQVTDERDESDHGERIVVADLDSAMVLLRQSAPRGHRQMTCAPVIVVSGPDRERELKQALECGVQGYLVAGFTGDDLLACVRTVRDGARYLCRRAASRLAESVNFAPLTEREEAVLGLVVQGLCNKSVARELGIASGTVKSHLKSAFGKLYVSNRTQAAVVSARRGLLAHCTAADAVPGVTAHA